jgi:hypothetical protein
MSLDPSRSLGFSRHADLKKRSDGPVLVLPERAIRIGGSGEEILRLVAEERTVASILSAMRERYPDSVDGREMAAEVLGFLEEMLGLGALIDLGERPEESA